MFNDVFQSKHEDMFEKKIHMRNLKGARPEHELVCAISFPEGAWEDLCMELVFRSSKDSKKKS